RIRAECSSSSCLHWTPDGSVLAIEGRVLRLYRAADGAVLAVHAVPIQGSTSLIAIGEGGVFDADAAGLTVLRLRRGAVTFGPPLSEATGSELRHPGLLRDFLAGRPIRAR